MSMSFEFSGMDEILAELEARGAQLNRIGAKALEAAAEPMLAKIKENAAKHIRTGTLQKALKIGKRKKTKNERHYIQIGVFGQDAPHAHLVELGHGGPQPAPPHPFMQPAYEAAKGEAYAIMAEKLKEELK